jgi:hypothetical protein
VFSTGDMAMTKIIESLKSKSPSSRRNSELYPRAIDEKKAPIGA